MTENEYGAVLITGNGFDLNLGLKTSYQDFITSNTFNNLLTTNNQLCSYLKNQHELNNWIDIENELKEYSNIIYKDSDRKVFRKEYQALCNSLCEYLNSLDMSEVDETSRVYEIITKKIKNLLIFNFNYTSSLDYIAYQNNLNHKILRVHGNARKNKIVFGVEDDARINSNDVFLKKSTSLWNEILNVNSVLSSAENIIFLGYSLGETDHHYFKDFFLSASLNGFMNKTRKNILISYYKEDGMYDILKQIDSMTNNRIQGIRTHHNFKMFDLAE
ncbi:hypothetical protein M2459_003142 [Parabacteroides sp. PF5-5]|uniref:AbiH family protein n=1 Tax=unclassified Parabacteroides TaxID=2649774 RepID=UPI002476575E|nr:MULTISPECIES: AbiH family protein [unclassified Parabacteroides]MDH6306418.1 hypothetical protein [Parabacteroides sp. PH5-39]MDH6317430.1 hypothetical protein [Parabacteroides sp. PF5-13]MDH6321129.1 hypothetical protein [Parabacteroides sp. PH5-13]MDH6324861.1 hypothetical protein [Parabacteroides sp. PH5-8]MDH6328615.1 hypothetical protein [Parabacteroides sp. PH5-41]